jgi:hypothetical protein
MSKSSGSHSHLVQPGTALDEAARRSSAWTKPVLVVYGDVRQLTMGPTPGIGESGNPGVLKA